MLSNLDQNLLGQGHKPHHFSHLRKFCKLSEKTEIKFLEFFVAKNRELTKNYC
jgi:hypothetical protein